MPDAVSTTWLDHRDAAKRAEDRCDWPGAIRAYESALAALPAADAGTADEAALLTGVGACYWNVSDARTAWRTLRRAMSLYRELGDAAGQARATVEVLRIWGPWDRQRAMADEALALLGDAEPYLRARLLFATAWRGRDTRFDDAMRIAEEHVFKDLLAERLTDASWKIYRDTGDIERSIALALQGHEAFAQHRAYEPACSTLRRAGFGAMEHGLLDRGVEIARRCVDYARKVGLRFQEQLALMDLAGVAFARADYDGCRALCDESPTNTDFRADLYRMWMAEVAGDTGAVLAMMVDPERAGRAATGVSQTNGAAAGVLYRAGRHDAAQQAMERWAEVARSSGDMAIEAPALYECIAALGDEALVSRVCDSYEVREPQTLPMPTYATLQGRAVAPAHGAMLVRLGRLDDAARVYREGLAWCERERVPVDAGRCREALANVASR